jgi:hypothetical protein
VLNLGIDVSMRANRSAYFADADALASLGEPFFCAPEFVIHQCEL